MPRPSSTSGFELRRGKAHFAARIDAKPPNPRLALLPPLTRTVRRRDAALAGALVEDLTLGLSTLHSVSVVAPHTARCLRDDTDWLTRLAQHRVHYMLDTRSTHDGLFLQLIHLPSDCIIWAGRFDLEVAALPERRQSMARSITAEIAGELERNDVFHADYARKPRAYHLYLAGLDRLKTPTLADVLWARNAFMQALDEQPHFAPALSGLSRTLSVEWLLRHGDDKGLLHAAEQAAQQAILHSPQSPFGHRELGVARLYLGDVDKSVDALTASVTLGPHYADGIYSLADSLVHASRPADGLAAIERAIGLNFLPPDMYLWSAAGACYFLRRYDEAVAYIARMKTPAPAARLAAAAWGMLGNLEQAAIERERVMKANPHFDLEVWLAHVPVKEQWQKDLYREGLKNAGF